MRVADDENSSRNGQAPEALLLVTSGGRILAATPCATAWLRQVFSVSRHCRTVPDAVRQWILSSHARRVCRPLTLENGSSHFVLSMLHQQADGSFPLLLQQRPLGAASVRARHLGLTRRQEEVHELLKQGRTNREIARALGISEATVKRHVEDVLYRLHVKNRTAAAGMSHGPDKMSRSPYCRKRPISKHSEHGTSREMTSPQQLIARREKPRR
jgi:DNA-binding CsgD family transcriptional regulator